MTVLAKRDEIAERTVSSVAIDVMDQNYLGMDVISAIIAASFETFEGILSVASRSASFDLIFNAAD